MHRDGIEQRSAAMVVESPLASAFRVKCKNYSPQFSQIYFCRLKELVEPLRAAASKKWGMEAVVLVDRILDLQLDVDCVILGTIFASLADKPQVLQDLEGDVSVVRPTSMDNRCS